MTNDQDKAGWVANTKKWFVRYREPLGWALLTVALLAGLAAITELAYETGQRDGQVAVLEGRQTYYPAIDPDGSLKWRRIDD